MRPLGSNTILTYGKYKGFKLIFIPSSYLFWLSYRTENDKMRSLLIEIASFNKIKELCYREKYPSVEEFINDASDGFSDYVTIVKVKHEQR